MPLFIPPSSASLVGARLSGFDERREVEQHLALLVSHNFPDEISRNPIARGGVNVEATIHDIKQKTWSCVTAA